MIKFQVQVDKFNSALKFDSEINPNNQSNVIADLDILAQSKTKSQLKGLVNNNMFDIGDI